MGVPTRHALSGNRLNGAIKREATKPSGRTNGLMFNSDALEKSARDTVARADATDEAQRNASSTEPYVVTRPNGRTVIVAKKDIEHSESSPSRSDDKGDDAKVGGMLATYNPSHPSVLFHKLKLGLLSRLEVLSLRKRLTTWLRSRTRKTKQDWRQARHARGERSRLIRHRSGLIIPVPDQPFMLSENYGAMDDLIAENQRLKRLVDEIIRSSPADLARFQR